MSIKSEIRDSLYADWVALRTARTKILAGAQEYTIGPRSFTMADLDSLNREIRLLQEELVRFGSGIRVKKVVVY